eukprot:gene1227-2699_t
MEEAEVSYTDIALQLDGMREQKPSEQKFSDVQEFAETIKAHNVGRGSVVVNWLLSKLIEQFPTTKISQQEQRQTKMSNKDRFRLVLEMNDKFPPRDDFRFIDAFALLSLKSFNFADERWDQWLSNGQQPLVCHAKDAVTQSRRAPRSEQAFLDCCALGVMSVQAHSSCFIAGSRPLALPDHPPHKSPVKQHPRRSSSMTVPGYDGPSLASASPGPTSNAPAFAHGSPCQPNALRGGASPLDLPTPTSPLNQHSKGGSNSASQQDYETVNGKQYQVLRDTQLFALKLRFSQEKNVVNLIDHEVNKSRQVLKILLEYGETDLQQLLEQEQNMMISHLQYWWDHMLRGVAACHRINLVHADLKPANFILVQGILKLIDFGIAGVIDDGHTSVHRGATCGTCVYLAPEQVSHRGKKAKLAKASDVWALGVIIYQLTFGTTPLAHHRQREKKIAALVDPHIAIK